MMARSRRSWGAIRRLTSGRFQARYPDPDTGQLAPAPETFANKTAADRWLAKKRTELDAGTAVDDRTGNRTLAEWWPVYARSLQIKKTRTSANYGAAWRLRIEPRFGRSPVRRIRPGHIDDWIADMVEQGTSASKVIESVGVLKRVLDLAVRDSAIVANPCALRSSPLPRRPKTERPVLAPAEVERLASAMRQEVERVLVRLLAYCGLRIGEALALERGDVDLKGRTLTVRRSVDDTSGTIVVGPTKTYSIRTITLPDALVPQLMGLADQGLLFPNRNGGYRRYRNWRRDVWDKACAVSGVVALPHDLRATCASLLIDAGASPKDVQAHLGHEDVQTTLQLYARVRPGRNADIAARLNALMAEVG